jgi:hypothetical protein
VVSEAGRRLKDFPVETNGQPLVEAVRMIPGHKHLVFEEGLQSAWLYETLRPHLTEIVVGPHPEGRGEDAADRDLGVRGQAGPGRHARGVGGELRRTFWTARMASVPGAVPMTPSEPSTGSFTKAR